MFKVSGNKQYNLRGQGQSGLYSGLISVLNYMQHWGITFGSPTSATSALNFEENLFPQGGLNNTGFHFSSVIE